MFNITEDPWENYLYYDAPQLVQLLAHQELLLTPAEQIILSHFICQTVQDETISEYKIDGK